MKKKKDHVVPRYLIFTGGGSGGHVMPALSLIEKIQLDLPHLQILYIGSEHGIEKRLVTNKNIEYKSISTGKFRRTLNKENIKANFKDIKNVFAGIWQSFKLLRAYPKKRTLVFSTGGFVSLPVVLGGFLSGKKVFLHEQTTQIGLANKVASRFASKIFVSFTSSMKFFDSQKCTYSGYPLRDDFFTDEVKEARVLGQIINRVEEPILLITGGGNGSKVLNEAVRNDMRELSKDFFIIHQVGNAFITEYSKLKSRKYLPVEFLGDEIIDLYKMADVIISRSGAGTVCELLALKKRSILVPLLNSQRDEQEMNAREAMKILGSLIINEEKLTRLPLTKYIEKFKAKPPRNKNRKTPDSRDLILRDVKKFFK